MYSRLTRSSRTGIRASLASVLGSSISVMLTKIRTKIRQTASHFRRTRRRSSFPGPTITSATLELHSAAPLPDTISARPDTVMDVDMSSFETPLRSHDTIPEAEAWWLRNRQSHTTLVPTPTDATDSLSPPSPLYLENGAITEAWWLQHRRFLLASARSDEMQDTSSSSSHCISLFSPLHTTEAQDKITPSVSSGSNDSTSRNDATPASIPDHDIPMTNTNDNNEHYPSIPNDNNALPYYGTTHLPLPPPTPPITPGSTPIDCLGVRLASRSLPVAASVLHQLDGQNLSVTIAGSSSSESEYDNLAIDEILQTLVSKPLIASIDVNVTPSCDDLPYAGKLVNDVFSVLLGCSSSPDSIAVRLPLSAGDNKFPTTVPLVTVDGRPLPPFEKITSSADEKATQKACPLVYLDQIPPLPQWWRLGRMDVSQLSTLTLSYPLPLDEFLAVLSSSKHLKEVEVNRLIPPRGATATNTFTILGDLSSLSMTSDLGLQSFFRAIRMPVLRRLRLAICGKATPNLYRIRWNALDHIMVACTMENDVEHSLRALCDEGSGERRSVKIVNVS